jgi:hypothetical protein
MTQVIHAETFAANFRLSGRPVWCVPVQFSIFLDSRFLFS